MAQLSGSDVSKVESDILQTINLADTVVTLVREPISLLYNNINKAKRLKQSLGVWRDEALDENGQSRIPVLRLLEFEEHLVTTDGKVEYPAKLAEEKGQVSFGEKFRSYWASNNQPSPSSGVLSPQLPTAGASCWSYFLYTLGIHPGMQIASWRPSIDGYINTQNGGVEMEIDGSVLCHIINLYSTTPDPDPWARQEEEEMPNRREAKQVTFPFGELAWEKVDGKMHAHFKPGLEKELASTKIPFGDDVGSKFEPGTLVASYLTALNHGVSDASFQLASPTAPISQRIERFVECFKALGSGERDPLIMSRDWFEEAARIKRRVLAEGGSNRSFYEDIINAIDAVDDAEMSDETKGFIKEEIRCRFFFEKDTFHFYLAGESETSRPVPFFWIDKLSRKVLRSYKKQSPGSWKRTLYESRDEVQGVLKVYPYVYMKKWLLVQEFTRSCELWKEKVLLGAPIVARESGQ